MSELCQNKGRVTWDVRERRENMTKLKELLESSENVIIVAHTEWCGYCKKFSPIFEEVSKEHGKQYVFAKVDAQKTEDFAKDYKIEGFPTILFIKSGKEVGREMGYMSKEQFIPNANQKWSL